MKTLLSFVVVYWSSVACCASVPMLASNLVMQLREARWTIESPSIYDSVYESPVSDQLVELGRSNMSVRTMLCDELTQCPMLFTNCEERFDGEKCYQYMRRLNRTMYMISPVLLAEAVTNAGAQRCWFGDSYNLLTLLQVTRHQECTVALLPAFDAACRTFVAQVARTADMPAREEALSMLLGRKPTAQDTTEITPLDAELGEQLAIHAINQATNVGEQLATISVLRRAGRGTAFIQEWTRSFARETNLHPFAKLHYSRELFKSGLLSEEELRHVTKREQEWKEHLVQRVRSAHANTQMWPSPNGSTAMVSTGIVNTNE